MYQSQTQPYAHQEVAASHLKDRRSYALLMAMRTGKTKVVIDDFGRLADLGKCENLLVVAPAGVYMTWVDELRTHMALPLLRRTAILAWSARGTKDREIAALFNHPGPKVLLVNVEALSAVARARDLCTAFLGLGPAYAAVDESTSIKNPRAKRTKFVVDVLAPLAAYRRVLTGLPTPRSPLDLYSQFRFLGKDILGYKTYAQFTSRYAMTQLMKVGGRHIRIVVGYRNQGELAEKIKPHSYRVRLEDCYDLPEKIYSKREIVLTSEQARIYAEMKRDAMAKISEEEFVTATVVVVQMLRLHQILCGHVADEQGQEHEIPENRTRALLELLDEHEGKAVVWCSYDADVRKVAAALLEEYGPGSVARFWGGNRASREDEERRFKGDDTCKFMVATAAAGGRGRQWAVADLVVYYSSTPDLEHRSQSEERVQKIGKARPVLYVDLVAPGTVDERFLKVLRSKIDLAATITGDNYREWLI